MSGDSYYNYNGQGLTGYSSGYAVSASLGNALLNSGATPISPAKSRHRFLVEFFDDQGVSFAWNRDVNAQCFYVGDLIQSRDPLIEKKLSIAFTDDISNTVCDAMQELYAKSNNGKLFSVVLTQLDPYDAPIRKHGLIDCDVNSITYGEHDASSAEACVIEVELYYQATAIV